MFLAHGWHAMAGQWVTNEKGLIPNVDRLPLETHNFSTTAAALLGSLGTTVVELRRTVEALRELPRPVA